MARTSRAAPSSGKGEPPTRVAVVLEATAAAAASTSAAIDAFIVPLVDRLLSAGAAGTRAPAEFALVAYRGRPPHSPAAVVRR